MGVLYSITHDINWSNESHEDTSLTVENIKFLSTNTTAFVDLPDVWPRYVKSLPVLLQEHLGLDDEDVNLLWVRNRDQTIDEQVWLRRPLTEDLAYVLVKDVVFLQGS